MREKGINKYKWQISIMTLVIFCLSLVPVPNIAIKAKAESISTKVNSIAISDAVVVGNLMKSNNLGEDWDPSNNNGYLKQYKNGIYESAFNLKAGSYEYKIAMNGSWDESYGKDGGNIKLSLSADQLVYFRFDYINKTVYDSINNPEVFKTKAVFVGNIDGLIEGATSWNPSGDITLDYIGGGIYKKTFPIKDSVQASKYNLEYKVAYNDGWNNGEVGNNVAVTVPAGTKTITILSDYLNGMAIDSVTNPQILNTVSLIGTIRNGNDDWGIENTAFDMYQIDESKFMYKSIIKAGSYEYKGAINHSWDGGGLPASGNNSINITEDKNVVFIADLNSGTIIDSINNLSDVESILAKVDNGGEDNPEPAVKSPIINDDGTVTFRVKYNGDTLYLVGSMNGWNTNTALPMTKNSEGVFELTTNLSAGQYEYKYIPTIGSWDGAFIDPGNSEKNNGNSLVNVPGLSLNFDDSVQVGQTILLKADVFDNIGNRLEATNVIWTLEEEVNGVTLEENKVIVSNSADSSKKIKIKATVDNYVARKEVTILASMYTYTVNYYRADNNYTGWNLWIWEPNKDGKSYEFNKANEAENGFTKAEYEFASDKVNFIVRKGNWEEKDVDVDRIIQVKEGNKVEVWIVQGDEDIYYSKDEVDISAKLKSAIMDSETEILVTSSAKIEDSEIETFKLKNITEDKTIDIEATRVNDTKVSLKIKNKLFSSEEIDVRDLYEVSSKNFAATKVTMRKILDSDKYYYNGADLGLTFNNDRSVFKLWAPTAKEVSLAIYEGAGNYDEAGKVSDNTGGTEKVMKRADNGVWSLTINEDLAGKYYMYKVSFADGTVNYAIDPYVKAVSANGQRGAIIDLKSTNPEGWSSVNKPGLLDLNDSIIYEMHVRDFSISNTSGISNKGNFKAFTEEGTTAPGTEVKTGVDHLKELGITHVQIMPSYDYGSVNEVSNEKSYNWGYDPSNYNVPEGSYSSASENPEARVMEFKEMVQSLHKNDIRVIMDVVYNHTQGIGQNSPFDPIVPGYFYRTDESGKYTNGSGCGNEVASERPMVRKYIKDSVKYWVKEYNVDGFRFDLMGLIDTKTIDEITKEVRAEIDPSIIIYGEPWQAGGSSLSASQQTLKGSQKDNEFAVFNDNFRSAIKGGSDDATKGFATGAEGKESEIVKGVMGSINDFTSGANETINYVTAHDNLNLWDKVVKAAGLDDEAGFLEITNGSLTGEDAKNYGSVEEAVTNKAKPYFNIDKDNVLDNELVKRSILTTGIIMTSQGTPFFQAGDEFLRSKYGDHNSYKSSDAINEINWENKVQFKPVFDYYQGLIELRKNHPAFRMSTKSAIESNLVVSKANENVVVFQLKDYANGDSWKNIVVVYNGNTTENEISLPSKSDWNVVVNGEKAGTNVLEVLKSTNKANVSPLSIMVLYDNSIEMGEQIPTTIDVNNSKIGINPGEYKFLKAIVRDQNGRIISGGNIDWKVSDEEIVSVNTSSGKVNGLKEGKATITLSCGNVVKEVEVFVEKLVPSTVKISGADSLFETKEMELSADVKDQFEQPIYNAEIKWSSSNEKVATVNSFGIVKGFSKGEVTITAKVGEVTASKKIVVNKYTKKYIEFTYVREDKDYTGWNIWTWQTGVEDGQKDFTTFEDGTAVARFEIAPDTSSVGFVLRKGTDWEVKDPYDSDRYIKISPDMTVTKVTIESGVGDFFQVPSVKSASIDKGKLTFQYRDDDLYDKNLQDTIDKVQVKVQEPALLLRTSEVYDMKYYSLNQYFNYSIGNLKSGVYKYSFLITKDGKTTETDVKEIEYKNLTINGDAEVLPKEITYDDNAVLTLKLEGEDANIDSIREIYMDLSNLGISKKVYMDLALLNKNEISGTIAVKDTVTTGDKEIKVVIVDKNGEEHVISTKVTVKSNVGVGPLDFGFDEATVYFAVTDRFFNGDTSNDDPKGNEYNKSGTMNYHGGDLKGLTEKISYLKELGINTIWITPIVENTDFNQMLSSGGEQYSYHGYWAKDFETLDPHLGTMEDLKNLIDKAHDNEIKIMVDVVLNHAGYGMNKVEANREANNYPTDQDRAKFEGMFRTNPGNDFLTQELSGLPDFKTEDKSVRDKLIAWQTSWIEKSKTEKGNTIDYFRVDTVKHVDNATWKEFKNELTEIDSDFKLIGEYYGADINNTEDQLQNGQMDALLDFQYKNKARDFVNGKIESTSEYLDDRASKIDNTNLMGQFLSSHDEDGFLQSVGNDLSKQMLAASLQITDKGIPVIYYGEELGVTGKAENDGNRYDMPWTRVNDEKYSEIYNHYKTLLNIREDNSIIFAKGDRVTIGGGDEEGYTVFSRTYNDKSIVVALNTDTEIKTSTVKVPFSEGDTIKDLYSNKEYVVDSNNTIKFEIPSIQDGGTVILTSTKETPEEEKPEEEKPPVENPEGEKLPVENPKEEKPSEQNPTQEENSGNEKPGENIKEEVPVNDVSHKNEKENQSTSKQDLPKTGNVNSMNLALVGVVLVCIGATVSFKKKKITEK